MKKSIILKEDIEKQVDEIGEQGEEFDKIIKEKEWANIINATAFELQDTITARRDGKTRESIKIEKLEKGRYYTKEVLKYCGWNIKELYQKKLIRIIQKEKPEGVVELKDVKIEEKPEKKKEIKKRDISNDDDEKILSLPGGSHDPKLVSDFAEEIAKVVKEKKIMFFRPSSWDVIEINMIKEDEEEVEYYGFNSIKSKRFITMVERYLSTISFKWNKLSYEMEEYEKSMSSEVAGIILESQQLQEKLYRLDRIFTVPIPIILDGGLTFPKVGYDERFKSWLPFDAPRIDNPKMSLEKAKGIIEKILCEFCWNSEEAKTNGISALITPFLRGLYSKFNVRSPVFFYLANRERAGKDYAAGCVGILYTGNATEEPPISSENKFSNPSEELRKKILGAFLHGKKRMHFANNKGHLDNAVFEQVVTSTTHNDRLLGVNKVLTFDNEIEFSLSGNVGITYSPDFANRCRFISLFLDIEDANSREFKTPDLHGWIHKNRGLILSAIYTLIRNWVEKGTPMGKTPFASYPEWAEICGGIMITAGYGDPCIRDKELLDVGGDTETMEMKRLFELCYEKRPDEYIDKQTIIAIISNNIDENENQDKIFESYDFEGSRSDQTKFGMFFRKFVGRVFSDIRLLREGEKGKRRNRYLFRKEVGNLGNLEGVEFSYKTIKNGNLGNFVNLLSRPEPETYKTSYVDGVKKGHPGNQGYQIEKVSKINNKENVISDLIHHKCVICGLTPCSDYFKNKPYCSGCLAQMKFKD